MVELTVPQFEFRLETGALALHDGFVVTFFLPASHQRIAIPVRASLERYLRLPGMPQKLGAIGVDGFPMWLDAPGLQRLVAERLDPDRTEADLHIIDSLDGASSFSIRYHGLNLTKLAEARWPNGVSGMRFTFPTDYLGDEGLLQMFVFANELAAILPYSFGYVSPAFVYLEGIGEPAAFKMIRSLSRRYPCLDVPALLPDCFELGEGPKGAYWGTYLGERLVERVGGEARLRNHLAGYDVRITPFEHGAMSVYLGPMPIGGDVNQREDIAPYQAAFGLLSTLMLPREMPYMHFDEEAMHEWLYRFADEDAF